MLMKIKDLVDGTFLNKGVDRYDYFWTHEPQWLDGRAAYNDCFNLKTYDHYDNESEWILEITTPSGSIFNYGDMLLMFDEEKYNAFKAAGTLAHLDKAYVDVQLKRFGIIMKER